MGTGCSMTVVEIKECVRKDVPIYYRRLFSGIAVLEIADKMQDLRLDWMIETSPLGTKTITITPVDKIDYPVIPLNKALKEKIEELDAQGKLPL